MPNDDIVRACASLQDNLFFNGWFSEIEIIKADEQGNPFLLVHVKSPPPDGVPDIWEGCRVEYQVLAFEAMRRRLASLSILQEGEEPAEMPTDAAMAAAASLLGDLNRVLEHQLPKAGISATEAGGVRFHWSTGSRHVMVEIRPDATNYFYQQEAPGRSFSQSNVRSKVIATALLELQSGHE